MDTSCILVCIRAIYQQASWVYMSVSTLLVAHVTKMIPRTATVPALLDEEFNSGGNSGGGGAFAFAAVGVPVVAVTRGALLDGGDLNHIHTSSLLQVTQRTQRSATKLLKVVVHMVL